MEVGRPTHGEFPEECGERQLSRLPAHQLQYFQALVAAKMFLYGNDIRVEVKKRRSIKKRDPLSGLSRTELESGFDLP